MSTITEFIKIIIEWGIWLGFRGLLKSAIIALMVHSAIAQQKPFSFGKFNRMLFGNSGSLAMTKNSKRH